MKITIQRKTLTPESTTGELFLDAMYECVTLEPPTLEPPAKPRAIRAGTYFWEKRTSPHFGFETVWVLGVPDFVAIEIHPGNFPKDTLGCTLVGTFEQQNFVGHSKEEFARLTAKLPDSGTIDYLDAPASPGEKVQDNPQAGVA